MWNVLFREARLKNIVKLLLAKMITVSAGRWQLDQNKRG